MSRIGQVEPAEATGEVAEIFREIEGKLGRVPNILKAMGVSPATLKAYVGISGAMGTASIPARVRERIALRVAELNHCEYCTAAHTAIGKSVGLSEEETLRSRRGEAGDPAEQEALRFAQKVLEERGFVSDQDLERLRAAGYDNAAAAEIVTAVAQNILTNYFNHVAATAVDFPAPPASK